MSLIHGVVYIRMFVNRRSVSSKFAMASTAAVTTCMGTGLCLTYGGIKDSNQGGMWGGSGPGVHGLCPLVDRAAPVRHMSGSIDRGYPIVLWWTPNAIIG